MAKVPNGVEIIAENFIWLSRVHERYRRQRDRQTDRQTDRRQTDGRQHIANSSRSLKSLATILGILLWMDVTMLDFIK